MTRAFRRFVLAAALAAIAVSGGRAQQSPAVEHAKRILDLLKHSFEKAYDVAVRNFERALRMAEKTRPGSQDVRDLHLELGQAYEGKGDLERAEALMRKALSEEEQRLRGIEGSLVKRSTRRS